MSALTIRLSEDKKLRLQQLAKARNISVNRMVDEMLTLLITEYEADARFKERATRGLGQEQRGRELLAKALQTGKAD
jgi:predicted transcriptional regulator